MRESVLSEHDEGGNGPSPPDTEMISAPERELRNFVRGAVRLFGPAATPYLTEIWLDEVACLECVPERSSSEWRTVSIAAASRLAGQLIALQLSN